MQLCPVFLPFYHSPCLKHHHYLMTLFLIRIKELAQSFKESTLKRLIRVVTTTVPLKALLDSTGACRKLLTFHQK